MCGDYTGVVSGEEGGNAVADILLGNVNPSAKMTVTVPRSNRQCPIWHSGGYNPDDMPLYPFGHGLSYTTYQYSNLDIKKTARTTDDWIRVSFDVGNTGSMDGAEITQLYVSAEGLSMPRPPIKLQGFRRVELKQGETRRITFAVSPQQFAFYNKDMELVIEPGQYTFKIGASSTDIRLSSVVEMSGPVRKLERKEIFFSETVVE
ncbi:hypothetical protein EGM51_05550 [Verrucomicrobia bacterium S94]|nr:hypothetical protein EGM51_05550 [Verrucomicrobia bacterium S94]